MRPIYLLSALLMLAVLSCVGLPAAYAYDPVCSYYQEHHGECCSTCHDMVSCSTANLYCVPSPISTTNSGDKPVVYDSIDSQVKGEEPYNGICEVCHTQTRYHRNNASGDHTHCVGQRCTACHLHGPIYMVSQSLCYTCHGGEPGDVPAGNPPMFTSPAGQSHLTHNNATRGPQCGDVGDAPGCTACHESASGGGVFSDGKPFATTDACNNCHSNGGAVNGVTMAKANWNAGVYNEDGTLKAGAGSWCISCHDNVPANSAYDNSGISAPNKAGDNTSYGYNVTGHGNTGTYNATQHGRNGPGYGCTVCHDTTASHISGTLEDTDRLKAVADDGLDYTTDTSEVCLDCHKVGKSANGSLGYDATAEATVHSGGVSGNFNTSAKAATGFPAYGNSDDYATSPGYQCDDCHDVHGTQKLAMILPSIDGNVGGTSNPVAVAGFESTDTDLRDLDLSAAADNGVCDTCHGSGGNPHPDSSKYPGNHNQGNTGIACLVCHSHTASFTHGGGGAGCDECHGHDAGFGGLTGGGGTFKSHSTHTENDDSDELKGPNMACSGCHDTNNYPLFSDGQNLANTTVCDTCHSPGGTYDGVADAVIGAKNNWTNGVYSGFNLLAGKEKWCAGCHDESPSVISAVTAPNVVGDEDAGVPEGYRYGTGYGFYKTGHGLTSGAYPVSGGPTADCKCTDCHDAALSHIDHDSRTYAAANDNYQAGYRLKYNMDIPRTDTGWPVSDFALCAQCHDLDPFFQRTNLTSNLRRVNDNGMSTAVSETVLTDAGKAWSVSGFSGAGSVLIPDIEKPWNIYPITANTETTITVTGAMLSDGAQTGDSYRIETNGHRYHLPSNQAGQFNPYAGLKWDSDWSATSGGDMQIDSMVSCPTCHNVHGSKFGRMVRDGDLISRIYDRRPGLDFYYVDSDLSYANPTPLSESIGGHWSNGSRMCGNCHGSPDGRFYRVPTGTVTFSSAADQYYSVSDPATEISTITITDNAQGGSLTATGDIRIRIPDSLDMTWDTGDTSAVMGGSATGKVNATVSFPNNKILLIDVTADFNAGDILTVSGLSFANFTALSACDNLELYIDEGHVFSTEDIKTIQIGTKATISSAADQTFAVDDESTAISPVTIRAITDSSDVNSSNDIRIKIPAATSMIWDTDDTTAVIEGSASGKVSSTVSFPDGKTLLIDVTSNFAEGEIITVSDLSFKDFTASSDPDNLELYVDGASDVTADGLDDKTVTIESLSWIMPTAVVFSQCSGGDMHGCDYMLDNDLTTKNLWPGYVAIFDLGREYLVTDLRLYVTGQAQWRFYVGNIPYGCLSGGTLVLDNWVIGASGAGWYEKAVTSQVSGRYLRVQYDAGGHAPEYLSELRFYGIPQDESTVISSADALDKNGGLAGIQSGDQVILTFDHATAATTIDGTNIETALVLNNGHTWGTIIGAAWSDEGGRVNDTLTITLDTDATVAFNDTITMGGVIKDIFGALVTGSATLKGSFDVLEPIQIIVDNENANNPAGTSFEFLLGAEQAGEWVRSTGCSGNRYLADYFVAPVTDTGETLKARWNFDIPWAGAYHVYAYYPTYSERPFDARFTVNHADGSTLTPAHQRSTCSGTGRCVGGWEKMGTFYFNNGSYSVELSNFSEDDPGYSIYADAIKIESITWFDGSDTEIILDNPAVEFIIDNTKGTPTFTGEDGYYLWPRSLCQGGYNGYMNQIGTDGGGEYAGRFAAKWILYFIEPGRYHVYGWWPGYWVGYANNAPFTINHAGGVTELRVNQRNNYNQWYDLGEYDFNAGQDHYIMISTDNSGGNPIADAIKLIRVEP